MTWPLIVLEIQQMLTMTDSYILNTDLVEIVCERVLLAFKLCLLATLIAYSTQIMPV